MFGEFFYNLYENVRKSFESHTCFEAGTEEAADILELRRQNQVALLRANSELSADTLQVESELQLEVENLAETTNLYDEQVTKVMQNMQTEIGQLKSMLLKKTQELINLQQNPENEIIPLEEMQTDKAAALSVELQELKTACDAKDEQLAHLEKLLEIAKREIAQLKAENLELKRSHKEDPLWKGATTKTDRDSNLFSVDKSINYSNGVAKIKRAFIKSTEFKYFFTAAK